MFKKHAISLMGLAALISSAALASTTVSANLTPQTTVTNNCIIVGGSLTFSNYDPLGGAQVDGSTTFSIQCTDLMTAPNILMDGGNSNTGTLSAPARRMKATVSATDYFLNYNLYSDNAGGTVWEGSTGVASPTPDGTAHNVTVYGRIAASQNVPAATYGDTVVISVVF